MKPIKEAMVDSGFDANKTFERQSASRYVQGGIPSFLLKLVKPMP